MRCARHFRVAVLKVRVADPIIERPLVRLVRKEHLQPPRTSETTTSPPHSSPPSETAPTVHACLTEVDALPAKLLRSRNSDSPSRWRGCDPRCSRASLEPHALAPALLRTCPDTRSTPKRLHLDHGCASGCCAVCGDAARCSA